MLEIGEIGAQVKHLAKTTMGSAYSIDRRKGINSCNIEKNEQK